MRLGYERIVKDNRITIEVEESDDPWVTLKFEGCPEIVRFRASSEDDVVETGMVPEMQNAIKDIIDAVHQAYIQATTTPF